MDHDPTSQPRLSRAPAAPDPHADAVRPAWAARDPLLRAYFDEEWGVPVREERALFEVEFTRFDGQLGAYQTVGS